ncbi:MAG: hypothetical protein DRN30_02295 [Thermoplasmata archaeon]|nr:MAG: hypothetical protein DRN30_02295 [Thermoplasmata archaeon]
MGIEYNALLNMTWKEYDYLSVGYERRIERQWDYTRHIIASQYNSTGMSKKTISAKEVMKLPTLDKLIRKELQKIPEDRLKNMLKVLKQNINV